MKLLKTLIGGTGLFLLALWAQIGNISRVGACLSLHFKLMLLLSLLLTKISKNPNVSRVGASLSLQCSKRIGQDSGQQDTGSPDHDLHTP